MNNDNALFHQVLQRHNERAARMKMPDDMEQRVMERIKPRHHRVWLYPAITAVAASILLLLTLHTQDPESSGLKSQDTNQAAEMLVWQHEDEQTIRDICFAHQKEIQEKGERLAAYIQQQTTINIE